MESLEPPPLKLANLTNSPTHYFDDVNTYLADSMRYFQPVAVGVPGACPVDTSIYLVPDAVKPSFVECTYFPAPLNRISLINGVLKYDHPIIAVNSFIYKRAYMTLEYYYGTICSADDKPLELEEAVKYLQLNTSSGWPWKMTIGTTKEEVLSKVPLDDLRSYYQNYSTLFVASEKDEIRPRGKDARIYRPAPIDHVLEAICLFYMSSTRFLALHAIPDHPSCVGQSTPGPSLSSFYKEARRWKYTYSIDGASHDANFLAFIVDVICHWYCDKYPEIAPRIRDYFARTYFGYTLVGSSVYPLIGQVSGHWRTTIDNCMHSTILVDLVMHEQSFKLSEYSFRVEGDDIYIMTNKPLDVTRACTYLASMGYYWEVMPAETPFDDLLFKGTHASGDHYTYRDDLVQSLFYWDRVPEHYVDKIVSLHLCLYYSPWAPLLRSHYQLAKNYFSLDSSRDRLLTDYFCEALYNGYESLFFLNLFSDIKSAERKYMSYRILESKSRKMESGPVKQKLKIVRPKRSSPKPKARKISQPRRRQRREYDQSIPISTSRVLAGRTQARVFTKGNIQTVIHSEYTHTFQVATGANGLDFAIFPETSTYGPTDVNPGFPAFLPWASNIAKDYERYRFAKLRFRLVPKQPTTSSGMVMMMFDYDFCDSPPTTKVEFLQNASSLEASTFTPITFDVNTRLLSEGTLTGGWRYVSNGASSSSTESRETMAGFLVVATDGLAANSTYSWDMWVDYHLELKVPRPPQETDETVQVVYPSGYTYAFQSAGATGMKLSNVSHNDFTVTPISGLGSILNNSSAPATAGVDSSRSTLFLRLMRQVAGVLSFDFSWTRRNATGGTNGPSAKGAVNTWILYGKDSGGNSVVTAYNSIPSRAEGSLNYNRARIKTDDVHDPSTDDNNIGMYVEFAIGPKVFQAIAAAGKKITDIYWELFGDTSVALAGSVAISSMVLAFRPYFQQNHRLLSLSSPSLVLDPVREEESDSDEDIPVAPQVVKSKRKT